MLFADCDVSRLLLINALALESRLMAPADLKGQQANFEVQRARSPPKPARTLPRQAVRDGRHRKRSAADNGIARPRTESARLAADVVGWPS